MVYLSTGKMWTEKYRASIITSSTKLSILACLQVVFNKLMYISHKQTGYSRVSLTHPHTHKRKTRARTKVQYYTKFLPLRNVLLGSCKWNRLSCLFQFWVRLWLKHVRSSLFTFTFVYLSSMGALLPPPPGDWPPHSVLR